MKQWMRYVLPVRSFELAAAIVSIANFSSRLFRHAFAVFQFTLASAAKPIVPDLNCAHLVVALTLAPENLIYEMLAETMTVLNASCSKYADSGAGSRSDFKNWVR